MSLNVPSTSSDLIFLPKSTNAPLYTHVESNLPSTSQAFSFIHDFTTPSSTARSDSLLLALRRSRPNTRLFRALFQYIPIRDSPNENPQLELPLQAGDYILVHGQMDEDQFYFGETLSGRTGLVPSNFVERVPDHLLLQNAARTSSPSFTFSTSAAAGSSKFSSTPIQHHHSNLTSNEITEFSRPTSPSFALNVPPHHSAIAHDFTVYQKIGEFPLPDSVCPYPPVDVSKVTVQEIRSSDQPRVPFPREIAVEKKLSRSAVISWLPPEDQLSIVSQYHVCVDGGVKAVVPGSYKCKALVEDLNLDRSVNISVRAITEHGHSPDSACTLSLGNEAPVAPQHLRVTEITPISAIVSWYPSNSNAEHVLLLNAIKVGVCPPAVFQVKLQGLSPSTIYRISVRTKHPKAVLEQRPVERCVDFKTLPKIGLPDPPSNVQVEFLSPGQLLISWRPVESQPKPPSRAAIHSYLIYADGRNIAQVPSATADHVLLRLSDFADDPPIFLTVRTRTREGAISADSNVVRVPRGITAANPNVLSASSLPFTSNILPGVAINTTLPPDANLAPSSLSTTVVGPVPPGIMHMGTSVPSQGLLTTLPQVPIAPGVQPLNTTFAMNQPAISASHPLGTQISQQQQLGSYPSPLTIYQQQQMRQYPLSTVNYYPSMEPKYSVNPKTATGQYQMNGGVQNNKAVSTLDWRFRRQQQQQQPHPPSNQYYTFHPKALYKEYASSEERPSVLEMENNYLLKHRQHEIEGWPTSSMLPDVMGRVRPDYYARTSGRSYTIEDPLVMPNRPSLPIVPGSRRFSRPLPPRLSRVRSEELLGTRSEPDLRPAILDDEENCRWFVALFDYDHLMSPNPNAQQEELTFRKHQLIKVFGEVDPDGFYRGQIGRRFGLVPSNMVIEIAKDDLIPPQRRLETTPPLEPAIRRLRWGSLKSRSYDHAGDRRIPQQHGRTPSGPVIDTYSLDRRDHSLPPRAPYHPPDAYDQQMYKGVNGSRESNYTRSHYGYPSSSREYPQRELYPSTDYSREQQPYEYRSRYDSEYSRDYYRRDKMDQRQQQPGDWDSGVDQRETQEFREGGYRPSERDYSKERARDSSGRMEQQQLEEKVGNGTYSLARGTSGGVPSRRDYGKQEDEPIEMGWTGAGIDQSQAHMTTHPDDTYMADDMMPQRINKLENETTGARKMVAKYDYDSRQLSPNVDAEQVELSFRQGDTITIYGDMDEDGFYMGELNGMHGLVPSNFLQPVNATLNTLLPPQPPGSLAISQQPTLLDQRPKGVAFTEMVNSKKPVPVRQSSQTSNKMANIVASIGAPAAAQMGNSVPKKSVGAPTGGAKALAKKGSDVSAKGASAQRKTSQAAKKVEGAKKKT